VPASAQHVGRQLNCHNTLSHQHIDNKHRLILYKYSQGHHTCSAVSYSLNSSHHHHHEWATSQSIAISTNCLHDVQSCATSPCRTESRLDEAQPQWPWPSSWAFPVVWQTMHFSRQSTGVVRKPGCFRQMTKKCSHLGLPKHHVFQGKCLSDVQTILSSSSSSSSISFSYKIYVANAAKTVMQDVLSIVQKKQH